MSRSSLFAPILVLSVFVSSAPLLAQKSEAPRAPRVAPAPAGAIASPNPAGPVPRPAGADATITLYTQDFQETSFPPDGWALDNVDDRDDSIPSEWELDYWSYPSDRAAYCIGPNPYLTYEPTDDLLYMTQTVDCLNTADVRMVFDLAVTYPGLSSRSEVRFLYWSSRTNAWRVFDSLEGPGSGVYTGMVAHMPAPADDAHVKVGVALYGFDRWDNVVIDDVRIRGVRSPDLLPYLPTTWPAPIVVSTSPGTRNQDPVQVGQTVYLDFAVQNDSVESVPSSTQILYDVLDGAALARGGMSNGIGPNSYLTWEDLTYTFATPGAHTLKLVCDSGAAVSEYDETNNAYELVVNVAAPDLRVESAWWQPAAPNSRQTILLGFNVRNYGTVASTPCHYSILIDGAEAASGAIPSVAGLGGVDTHQNVQLGPLSAGTHEIRIVADALGEVVETDEGNNAFTTSISVAGLPDLRIQACRLVPASPDQTQRIGLEFDARNDGDAASTTVDFVVREGAVLLYQGRIAPIAPGGVATTSGARIGPLPSGSHTLTIEADSGHALAEFDETNNAFAVPLTVRHVLGAREEWILYE